MLLEPSASYPYAFLLHKRGPCACCHRETRWASLNLEAYLCSYECYQAVWAKILRSVPPESQVRVVL